jgi:hypothetical protein
MFFTVIAIAVKHRGKQAPPLLQQQYPDRLEKFLIFVSVLKGLSKTGRTVIQTINLPFRSLQNALLSVVWRAHNN